MCGLPPIACGKHTSYSECWAKLYNRLWEHCEEKKHLPFHSLLEWKPNPHLTDWSLRTLHNTSFRSRHFCDDPGFGKGTFPSPTPFGEKYSQESDHDRQIGFIVANPQAENNHRLRTTMARAPLCADVSETNILDFKLRGEKQKHMAKAPLCAD
eukprot:scaffold3662_cov142-Cylindrotheca_fusiformis.AAC.1